jgi:Mn2+/Fe2+ NRAMP family transporter
VATGKAGYAAQAQRSGRPGRLRRAWRLLGRGLITGASDDDPSGIAADLVAVAS